VFRAAADAGAADAVLAVRGVRDAAWPADAQGLLAQWQPYTLVLEVDGEEVGRWGALELTNALAEVTVHIALPGVPLGEHYASGRLLLRGAETEIEEGVTFLVKPPAGARPPPAAPAPRRHGSRPRPTRPKSAARQGRHVGTLRAQHSPKAAQHRPRRRRTGQTALTTSPFARAAPPPPRTKWTRRGPPPVLIGHAASLTPY